MEDVVKREDCENAIRNYLRSSNFILKEYVVKPFSDKNIGFMGRHFKLTASVLIDDQPQKIHFFVKMLPANVKHRALVTDLDFFAAEVANYNILVPMFNSCLPNGVTHPVPKCYLSRGTTVKPGNMPAHDSKDEDIIILEDMSSRGYQCRENFPAMDVPHCHAVLRSMARYHASSMLLEESYRKSHTEDFDPKRDLFSNIEENFLVNRKGHSGYKGARHSAEDMSRAVSKLWPEKYNSDSRDTVMEALMTGWTRVFEMAKTSKKFPNVICHGDPWTNNILFKYQRDEEGRDTPVDALFVDLQVARYAPPILDILIFLHVCTKRDFRERNLNELLKFYHDALGVYVAKEVLERVLPYGQLLEMSNQYRDFGCIMSTCYLPIILSENDPLLADKEKVNGSTDPNIFSDKYDQIINNCNKSKNYREWITQSYQECLETLKLWT